MHSAHLELFPYFFVFFIIFEMTGSRTFVPLGLSCLAEPASMDDTLALDSGRSSIVLNASTFRTTECGSTFRHSASAQTTCLDSFVLTPTALWLCGSLSCSSLSDLTCSQVHISFPPCLFPLVFDLCTSDIFSPDLKGRSTSVSAWNHHIWSYKGETCNTRTQLYNIC